MHFKALRSGERTEVDGSMPGMTVTLGCGRGSSATLDTEQNLVLAVRGHLRLETADGLVDLEPGCLLMGNPGRIRAVARNNSLWLALSGPTESWRKSLLTVISSADERDPIFYPHSGACPRALKRAVVRLALHVRRGAGIEGRRAAVGNVFAQMWDAQREIDDLSRHCAGRTSTRRRQNLLRLIRVRHRILMNPAARIELTALAASANYSPWHFIRSFRDVFGEAPCEYGKRVRLEHAHRLVNTSQLSITEVAGAVGYDSRSAFCRSFRQAYGMSATDARMLSRRSIAALASTDLDAIR